MENKDLAVIVEADVVLSESELENMENFRQAVLAVYKTKHPTRVFDNDALFVNIRKNTVPMTHLDNIETVKSSISGGVIRVSVGAQQITVADPENGYPIDINGHHLPPVLWPVEKTVAAVAQRDTEQKVNTAINLLYRSPTSPLLHGFNRGHVPFISVHLMSTAGKPVLDELLQQPPYFRTDIKDYLQPSWVNWTNQLLVKETGSVPKKDSCKPKQGNEIPPKEFNPTPSNSRAASDSIAVADSLMAIANNMPRKNVAFTAKLNDFLSFEAFVQEADLDADDVAALTTAKCTTLNLLNSIVQEAKNECDRSSSSYKSFKDCILQYINGLTVMGCMKILAAAIKGPSAAEA